MAVYLRLLFVQFSVYPGARLGFHFSLAWYAIWCVVSVMYLVDYPFDVFCVQTHGFWKKGSGNGDGYQHRLKQQKREWGCKCIYR